jgi:hypothetical protein
MEIIIMSRQFSMVLGAALLTAGVWAASATEMKQSFGTKVLPSASQQYKYSQHNVYAGHSNSKVQRHAGVSRAPWHNAE